MNIHSPSGVVSEVKSVFQSMVVSVSTSTVPSSVYVSMDEVSGAEGVVPLSPRAGVGGGGGSVVVGTSRALVGGGGGGTGNNHPVELGPVGCMSSSLAGLVAVVVAVVVFAVVGMTVGASVVGGPVGTGACATVRLREDATGGSVGLAVIFEGPGTKEDRIR